MLPCHRGPSGPPVLSCAPVITGSSRKGSNLKQLTPFPSQGTCLVRFDNNKYSMPKLRPGRPVYFVNGAKTSFMAHKGNAPLVRRLPVPRSSLRAWAIPLPAASSRGSTARAGTSPAPPAVARASGNASSIRCRLRVQRRDSRCCGPAASVSCKGAKSRRTPRQKAPPCP